LAKHAALANERLVFSELVAHPSRQGGQAEASERGAVQFLFEREVDVLAFGVPPFVRGQPDGAKPAVELAVGELHVRLESLRVGEDEHDDGAGAEVAVAVVIAPPAEQERVVGLELRLVVRRLGGERQLERQVEPEVGARDPELDARVGPELGECLVGRGWEERPVIPVGTGGRSSVGVRLWRRRPSPTVGNCASDDVDALSWTRGS